MSDGTYGHRRIQAQLHRWGVTASLELVRSAGSCANWDLSPASRSRKGTASPRPRPAKCRTSSAATSPLTHPVNLTSRFHDRGGRSVINEARSVVDLGR
ncbi:hypothetical protein [Streptomyces sp. NPDC002619]|uniref:hypothetical protein n=1 Tax=Streptomyces sp. NPDC002619 TaxID=3364655 RepID=UPI0036CC587D